MMEEVLDDEDAIPPDICRDCGHVHESVWAAIACDEFTDARARRSASRHHRLQHRRMHLDDVEEI